MRKSLFFIQIIIFSILFSTCANAQADRIFSNFVNNINYGPGSVEIKNTENNIISTKSMASNSYIEIYEKNTKNNKTENISSFSYILASSSNINNELFDKKTISSDSIIDANNEFYEHDGKKYKKGEDLGSFKLTGYCACKKCSSGTGITYSGKYVRQNHTVAADLSVLPLGTFIIIDGIDENETEDYNGVYQVEDKGGGVKNKHIDIYQPTHELASLVTYFGDRYAHVFLAEPIE